MRNMRLAPVAMALLVAGGIATAVDSAVQASEETTYYVAMGDSLAAGWQPIGDPQNDHLTRASYPDQLWLMARQHYRDLQLVNLACPGENTETIRLDNGRCEYQHGSQLGEALAFIEEHHDQMAFITIDIGFADFDCIDGLSCLFPGIENIEERLPPILAELQEAAAGVPIVGMNIYDPYLNLWLEGEETLARRSVVAIQLINEALEEAYADAGITVADVERAYETEDWDTLVPLAGHGDVPRNVALLCQRTWQCFGPPLGPDWHSNALGFRALAEAFVKALDLEVVGVSDT